MTLTQLSQLVVNPALQFTQLFFGTMKRKPAEVNHSVKVGDCKFAITPHAIVPNVPNEERKHNTRIARKEVGEVENKMVVQCGGHTHFVQSACETLQVLDGVGVGVEHEGVVQYGFRKWRCPLQQVVVVGIHTGYHVVAHLFTNQTHQCGFLSPLQFVFFRRQHHFKISVSIFKTA